MVKGDEYELNGEYVTIWGFVKDVDTDVIVLVGGDYGELQVVRKSGLKKKEESYRWLQEVKRKNELEAIAGKAKADLEGLASTVVDKALQDLASRLKFNVMFGKSSESDTVVLTISRELEKLVKSNTAKALKPKDPFE